MSFPHVLFISGTVLVIGAGSARAVVTEFTDSESWQVAVGQFTTITFAEFPEGGAVTNQYASLGINFPDGNDFFDSFNNNYLDGFGLSSQPPFGPIHFVFDTPQLWIAADFIGGITINLFSEGDLIYSSVNFQVSGTGNFGGLVSTRSFDEVTIADERDANVFIDDLHFGVPAPGALGLFALAGLGSLGRRRRG